MILSSVYFFRWSRWFSVRGTVRGLSTCTQRHTAYIVQGHRFDIFEQVGCYPNIVNMLPAYFLVAMWPLVVGLISATYCGALPFPSEGDTWSNLLGFRTYFVVIPSTTSAVFPVHDLKLLFDYEPIPPVNGSRQYRIIVHHPSRHLPNSPQRESPTTRSMGQLGRYSLQL